MDQRFWLSNVKSLQRTTSLAGARPAVRRRPPVEDTKPQRSAAQAKKRRAQPLSLSVRTPDRANKRRKSKSDVADKQPTQSVRSLRDRTAQHQTTLPTANGTDDGRVPSKPTRAPKALVQRTLVLKKPLAHTGATVRAGGSSGSSITTSPTLDSELRLSLSSAPHNPASAAAAQTIAYAPSCRLRRARPQKWANTFPVPAPSATIIDSTARLDTPESASYCGLPVVDWLPGCARVYSFAQRQLSSKLRSKFTHLLNKQHTELPLIVLIGDHGCGKLTLVRSSLPRTTELWVVDTGDVTTKEKLSMVLSQLLRRAQQVQHSLAGLVVCVRGMWSAHRTHDWSQPVKKWVSDEAMAMRNAGMVLVVLATKGGKHTHSAQRFFQGHATCLFVHTIRQSDWTGDLGSSAADASELFTRQTRLQSLLLGDEGKGSVTNRVSGSVRGQVLLGAVLNWGLLAQHMFVTAGDVFGFTHRYHFQCRLLHTQRQCLTVLSVHHLRWTSHVWAAANTLETQGKYGDCIEQRARFANAVADLCDADVWLTDVTRRMNTGQGDALDDGGHVDTTGDRLMADIHQWLHSRLGQLVPDKHDTCLPTPPDVLRVPNLPRWSSLDPKWYGVTQARLRAQKRHVVFRPEALKELEGTGKALPPLAWRLNDRLMWV